MSTVDTKTGELIAEVTPAEAREITDTIRDAITFTWEVIADAFTRQVWRALGYASWTDYTAAEFEGARLRLPPSERMENVLKLRSAGMSTRAIADGLGVSKNTVKKDLLGQTDPVGEVTGSNGKKYAAKNPRPQPKVETQEPPAEAREESAATLPAEPATTGPETSEEPATSLVSQLPPAVAEHLAQFDDDRADLRADLHAELAKGYQLLGAWPADDVIEIADSDLFTAINAYATSVQVWANTITTQRPQGLRVIAGGAQ